MAKDTKPLEEWNANAQRTLEQTMEHTRGVLGQYFKFLEQTLSSYPSAGTEFGEKLKSYAEKNIATAHEYVNKLAKPRICKILFEFRPNLCKYNSTHLANRRRVSARRLQRQQQMRSRSLSEHLD